MDRTKATIIGAAFAGMIWAAPVSAGEDHAGALATSQAATAQDQTAPAALPKTMAKLEAGAVADNALKPVNGRIIHKSPGGKMCIGGLLCSRFCAAENWECEPKQSLTIWLDEPARINAIQLSAHDNIGKTRRSRLVIKVNGKPAGDTLVYRLGSTLSIDVGEIGELITIESAHQYNGFLLGGEEAVIWDVYVFGEKQG